MKSSRSVENLLFTLRYTRRMWVFLKTQFFSFQFWKKIFFKLLYKMISSTCSCIARGGNMDNIIRTRWKPEVKREKKSILPEKAEQKQECRSARLVLRV